MYEEILFYIVHIKVFFKERFVMPEEREMLFSEFLDVMEQPDKQKGNNQTPPPFFFNCGVLAMNS